MRISLIFFGVFSTLCAVDCLPDQGIWSTKLDYDNQYFTVYKSLFNNSEVKVKIECHSVKEAKVKIGWLLRMTECADEYVGAEDAGRTMMYYTDPRVDQLQYGYKQIQLQRSSGSQSLNIDTATAHEKEYSCAGDEAILLTNEELLPHSVQLTRGVEKKDDDISGNPSNKPSTPQQNIPKQNKTEKVKPGKGNRRKRSVLVDRDPDTDNNDRVDNNESDNSNQKRRKRAFIDDLPKKEKKPKEESSTKQSVVKPKSTLMPASNAVTRTWQAGIYLFILRIDPLDAGNDFSADVTISMKGPHGYLSAIEWPLLPFYGVMCGVYVLFACAWLIMSACNWRDLLRIQFWIGAVIILGMLEKAVFYAEYQTINNTGKSVQGAVVFAEIVSCLKRTLARMLVVIVSLGYGIVKPRLGAMLHRILGMGILYFILGTIEGCLRINKPKGDVSNGPLLASIPLAVLDAAICWWVFTSLVNTTRTLRLRRNIVKLSLYRHFTNVLIFCVLASIAFMIWSIKQHKLANCLTDWMEIWIDDAYWHILFSVILLAIIILWRPTINNQRYAFSPLLDPPEDEETEDEDAIMNDAFDGMKMRVQKDKKSKDKSKTEDDLKWIEENIPSSVADTALPAMLDSDEEIMTTKFEMSKME